MGQRVARRGGGNLAGGETARRAGAHLAGALVFLLATAALPAPAARAADAADARLQRIEDQLRAVTDELHNLKQERNVDGAKVAEVEQQVSSLSSVFDRVRLGGYGSMRYEKANLANQTDTFTFRRLVFTTEAQIHPRLNFYSEVEYERFRKLELERTTGAADGGLFVQQSIEGTSDSEIALEQAWFNFELDPRLQLRAGAVLVPLGRFNIRHDDDLWLLPRRTLVDRGSPVLPIAAAWDELGAGLNGRLAVGEGELSYQLFVVNGATIDAQLETAAFTRTTERDKIELEGEFSPQTGPFSNDLKNSKAVTGRFSWSPAVGHEIAASFYTGRYTPKYLDAANVASLSVDGLTNLFGIELEGEFVTTGWEHIEDVAGSFAARGIRSSTNNDEIADPTVETEVEYTLNSLAKRKTGYWIEARYPFWPSWLPSLGFSQPQLIPVARFEQVWFKDLLGGLTFSDGLVTGSNLSNHQLTRGTLGFAYRPVPSVALTLAYEYIYTGGGSLVGLTNYLPARENEGSAQSFLTGLSFGF